MLFEKNKLYHYIFLIIISLMVIFNGGNFNLYIQFNFVIVSIFFLLIIRQKNYLANLKNIILKNRLAFIFYSLFLGFIIFQTIPIPMEWLNFFSPEKYQILNKLEFNGKFHSISLNPIGSYFSLLNYLTLFLYLIIFKTLYYKKKNILKFYYFLSFTGAFAASFAIYFYLIGNPDFWMIKNITKSAATGFFINRTVFSCFLILCFFSGIEYLKNIDKYKNEKENNFFNKVYIRFFILLITIGIITSFSRLGNFLFISLIILYILKELFNGSKKNRFFLISLIIIVIFDVLILGFYFGSEQLIQRYSFLHKDISSYSITANEDKITNIYRGTLAKFAITEFKKFIFFGYGGGGFEYLFKINFINITTKYALHAHSDLIEFVGEFGLVGLTLITLSVMSYSTNKKNFLFKNFLLLYLLIFILIFDFSLHVPIIQLLFILLFSINFKQSDNFK
tara:strand:+ start:189 stop:1538 length:1350 start_codon:yes stop_codon:yes gene_type:complete